MCLSLVGNFIGWGGGYSVAFISSATYAIVFNFNLNNNLTRGATNYVFPPPNYGLSKAVIHSSYTCNDFHLVGSLLDNTILILIPIYFI